MWGIAGAMNLNVSTLRTAWDLGFWVLIGVNGAALTVALFSSGKLLELLVGGRRSERGAEGGRELCRADELGVGHGGARGHTGL